MYRTTRVLHSINKTDFDIVIVGAGLVGATLARALEVSPVTRNLKVALVDKPMHFQRMSQYKYLAPGVRTSALNQSTINTLNRIGLWNTLYSKTMFNQVNAFDKDNYMVNFYASDVSSEWLGAIVDNDEMIFNALSNSFNVHRFPASQTNIENVTDRNQVIVTIDDKKLVSKVVIGCDGRDSIVRKVGNFASSTRAYPLSSFVCMVECDRTSPTTYQKFSDKGILALLPISQTLPIYSIVFTTDHEFASDLNKSSEEALISKLQLIWNMGTADAPSILRLHSPIKGSFPLFRGHVDQYHSWNGKLFVLGDAAHQMLPIAGQGFNMGVFDIAQYIQQLQGILEAGQDITSVRNTKEWWWRNETTIKGVEAIREAFGVGEVAQSLPPIPFLDQMRHMGFRVLSSSAAMRRTFIEQAMGVYSSTDHIGTV
jgi:2-octaprenylphenol hydroxylase